MDAYPEKLRPKAHIGDFYADDSNCCEGFNIQEFHGYWSGEIAAARMIYNKYIARHNQQGCPVAYCLMEVRGPVRNWKSSGHYF
jgi:hypothetical protein